MPSRGADVTMVDARDPAGSATNASGAMLGVLNFRPDPCQPNVTTVLAALPSPQVGRSAERVTPSASVASSWRNDPLVK